MPINEERLNRIQAYGLTEYEARTYLALLDLERATAREIANLSRVPRTKIYSVLDDLHEKRLAQIIPERPKRYEVVPFAEYLKTFEQSYRDRLTQIQDDKRELTRELTPPGEGTEGGARHTGSFNVVKGRKNVMNKKHEMLQRARVEVYEMGSPFAAQRMAFFLPLLRERSAKGLSVRVLVPLREDNEDAVGELRTVADVRGHSIPNAGSTILVVDDAEVLITHYVPDDGQLFKGDDVAMWTDDPAIVRDMKHAVLANWRLGKETPGIPAREPAGEGV